MLIYSATMLWFAIITAALAAAHGQSTRWYLGCGKSIDPSVPPAEWPSKSSSSRVVGGEEAKPHTYPWQISLETSWGFQFCGGSIITEEYILTAAHCVVYDDPEDLKVVVGDHSLTVTEPSQKDMLVSQISVHPFYDSFSLSNDFALLRLDTMLEITDKVAPVCAPYIDYDDGKAVTSGWGQIGAGMTDNVLNFGEVDLIDNELCDSYYRPTGNPIDETMICAGTLPDFDHADACQGDSGGPLVVKFASTFQIVGVVSWGIGCGRYYPGVYSRVYSALDWIDNYV